MRSKILDTYLTREMVINWIAVTVVLLVIMVGNTLARGLTRVSDGRIASEHLAMLVGIKSIGLLVTLIPLGLYLGILLAHGRFYRDNEIAVMHACGASWWDLIRPSLWVGLVGTVLIGVLSVFVSPWSVRMEQQLKQEIQNESGLGLLQPGRFNQSSDGSTVFFARGVSPDGARFDDVFVARSGKGKPRETHTAKTANYQKDPATGDEYLVFVDGESIVGQPGRDAYSVTEFKHQGLLRPRQLDQAPVLKARGKTMSQLWSSADPRDQAQLQWRISIPLAALLLSMLAVPLAYMSPREGRYSRIAVAILVYIPYANLLVMCRKWIEDGQLPVWIGLWPVHVVVVVLFLWLLRRRVGSEWLRLAGWKGI